MRKSGLNYVLICVILISSILFTSCATLLGGGTYNAHVVVNKNHPNAEIKYQGKTRGYGTATFKVPRSEANSLSFTVKEDGCPEQTYNYKFRTFRVGAFLGSVVVWTGIGVATSGFVIPCGPIIDFASCAIWKPSIVEAGVSQENVKTFRYLVDYDHVASSDTLDVKKSIDVVYLKDGNIFKGYITEQTSNVQIKMQTNDGNKFTFQFVDILKIEKEKVK
jgi:hypothetical protein